MNWIWFLAALRRFIGMLVCLTLLTGCSSTQNLLNPGIFDSFGNQVAGLFSSEKKIEFDEAELAELETVTPLPSLWKSSIGDSEIAVFSPVFDNGIIYAADEDGKLAAFNSVTGNQIWRIDTKHKLSGGVGAGEGMVLVGTFKGEVLAYDEKGNALWKARVTSEVLSPPQTANDIVIARTVDGRIFGLDALDGSRKWVYQGATPSLTVRSTAGVSISRGAVFAGFAGGKLAAMSLFNGNVGWEVVVSQPRGVTELERMTDITSPPVVDGELVCAVAYQGRVACFDMTSGAQIWARDASSNAGLAMDNDYIYVSEDNGIVAAYDKVSGAGVWKQSRLGSKKLAAPLVQNHYVVVGDHLGHVTVLRNYDGAVIARSGTDGSPIVTPPEGLSEGFVVQTLEGGLFAFNTEF